MNQMNQREIKFQSIHKDRMTGKITLIEWGPIKGGFKSPSSISNSELIGHREFTGLKDKHGNEIYEGDILEYTYPDKMEETGFGTDRCCCEFKNGCFGWIGSLTGEHFPFEADDSNYWAALGNIYEHPHLLENAIISPQKTTEP